MKNKLTVTRGRREGDNKRKTGKGQAKEHTGIEGSWAQTMEGALTVGVGGLGVSNGEKGGITVTEQQ